MSWLTGFWAKAAIALSCILFVTGLWAWGQEGHWKARQAANEAKVIATQRDTALEALRLFKRAAAHDQEVLRDRAAVALKQQVRESARLRKLNESLQAARDWAVVPVPDGVWDALFPDDNPGPGQAAASGKPAGPVPNPGNPN